MKTEACLGTFRVFGNGHFVAVYPISAKSGWPLERTYVSGPLLVEHFEQHDKTCGEDVHLVGYGAMAPEDIEEHFGLALATEILLGLYRACAAQMVDLGSIEAELSQLTLVYTMMERTHDALALALEKRKMLT